MALTGNDLLDISLEIARRNTDVARKREASKIYDFLAGNQIEYIKKNPAETTEHFNKRPKVFFNLTEAVAETLALLYSRPVKREFIDEKNEPIQAIADTFQEVCEDFTAVMQDIDELTILEGVMGIRPIWDEEENKITFRVYTPDMIDVYETDEGRVEAVVIEFGVLTPPVKALSSTGKILVAIPKWDEETSNTNIIKHIWTREMFYKVKDGKVVEETPNAYGEIPIVFFRNQKPIMDFWSSKIPGRQIVNANETLNKMMTDLIWGILFQSHGQLALYGARKDFIPIFGPDTYINLPENAKAEILAPKFEVEKILFAVNSIIDMALLSLRIPKGAVRMEATQTKSGVALVAEQAPLIDFQKKRALRFKSYEKKLIQLALKTADIYGQRNIPENYKVRINYTEPKEPLNQNEMNMWQFKFLNNIASPVDFLMAKDPDLTRDEAEKIVIQNKAWFKTNTVSGLSTQEKTTLKAKIEGGK